MVCLESLRKTSSRTRPSPGVIHPRCNDARIPGPCTELRPELRLLEGAHFSACHYAETLPALSTTDLAVDIENEDES